MNLTNAENEAKQYMSTHKKVLLMIGAALLLLFVGFVSGRYTSTPKTIEKTKVVEKTKDVVQTQDHTVKKQDVEVAKKRHIHTETATTKKPDGTVTTTTKTDDDTDTGVSNKTNTDVTHVQVETKYVDRIIEKEKLVLKQPDWRLTVGGGISIPYYIGQGSLGVPGMQGWVIQAGVDRRILGPFWLGVAGNTQGTLLVNLSAVW